MTTALYAQLAVLALIDSTSIGTLLIPLWLLLRPDVRRVVSRILLYLAVLAAFYFAVGVGVLSGADWVVGLLGSGSLMALPVIHWVMVLGGGGMLVYAFATNPKKREERKVAAVGGGSAPPVAATPPSGSAAVEVKWQGRLAKALRSPGGVTALALLAGLLELPTMLPYLLAIGLLTNSTLPLPGDIAVLAGYCLLMLVPALLLLLLRVVTGSRLEPLLRRVSGKLGKFAGETLIWVIGIVGFLLLRDGLLALAPDAPWNPFK